jgi:hypothetical protein
LRGAAWYGDQVGDAHQIEGRVRVGGIEATIAVGFEVVAVDFGGQRLRGNRPNAGRIFFHGDGLGDAVEGECDFCGRRIFVGEGDAAVGVNLGGMETRGGLGSEREWCGKCNKQGEFAGGAGRDQIHMRKFS